MSHLRKNISVIWDITEHKQYRKTRIILSKREAAEKSKEVITVHDLLENINTSVIMARQMPYVVIETFERIKVQVRRKYIVYNHEA